MIDEVIAFEPPDNTASGRRAITDLRRNMRTAGIPGRAYFGSFEEVVLLRKDFDGDDYIQNQVVTLYNLDFCNEVGSKVRTREGDKRVWRFEAIRQVLRDQFDCYRSMGGPSHFILMLTVRNQIKARKIREYLQPSRLQGDAKEFYKKCSAESPIPTQGALVGSHPWALKTLLHNMLCNYFGTPNFSGLFFPQVLYQGTRVRIRGTDEFLESPMLHWLVLCRFGEVETPTPDFWPDEFLSSASVAVQDEARLTWAAQTGEESSDDSTPNAVEWLTQHGEDILARFRV
jgi:hypothetical protein